MKKNNKLLITTLITTEGSVNLPMTIKQLTDLTILLNTENEPIPVYTMREKYDVVGVLIRGKSRKHFPRIIVNEGVKDEE